MIHIDGTELIAQLDAHGWLPTLSGCDEAEMVTEYGE